MCKEESGYGKYIYRMRRAMFVNYGPTKGQTIKYINNNFNLCVKINDIQFAD